MPTYFFFVPLRPSTIITYTKYFSVTSISYKHNLFLSPHHTTTSNLQIWNIVFLPFTFLQIPVQLKNYIYWVATKIEIFVYYFAYKRGLLLYGVTWILKEWGLNRRQTNVSCNSRLYSGHQSMCILRAIWGLSRVMWRSSQHLPVNHHKGKVTWDLAEYSQRTIHA